MTQNRHHVFLVPGFFGFINLGDLLYFSHVRDFLNERFHALGILAEVHSVHTAPTASIRSRAVRLLQAIADKVDPSTAPVLHLIGHSTGGLDARLLATPGVSLKAEVDVSAYAKNIRSVVTVATPHYGTPLASFATTLFGAQLMKLFSLVTIYVLRFGRLPMEIFLKIGSLFTRMDDYVGLRDTVVDQIFAQLLGDFTPERRESVKQLFEEMYDDRSLFTQLEPEGIDLFNASAVDNPNVRYGSVVTGIKGIGLASLAKAGLDPYAQASHAIFVALNKICRRNSSKFRGRPTADQAECLRRAFGEYPSDTFNDGVIPTNSQIWGEIVHARQADHLDVIGYFRDPHHLPPHYDWLASGSGFNRTKFEQLWTGIVDFIVKSG
jgi:pimeloyl-ACP methyl ester carboxylesterase